MEYPIEYPCSVTGPLGMIFFETTPLESLEDTHVLQIAVRYLQRDLPLGICQHFFP